MLGIPSYDHGAQQSEKLVIGQHCVLSVTIRVNERDAVLFRIQLCNCHELVDVSRAMGCRCERDNTKVRASACALLSLFLGLDVLFFLSFSNAVQ